jgi:O-antigen/teichoic acid export membrane protein
MAAPPDPAGNRTRPSIRGLGTVVGDMTAVTGAQGVALALSVGTVLLTTRLIGPDSYAVIAYVGVLSTLLLYGAAGWSSAALVRYGREELDRTGTMVRTSWARLSFTLPLAAAGAVLVTGLKTADVLPREYSWPFVWLTIALGALLVVNDHFMSALQAAGRMRLTAAALAGRQLVLVAGLSVLFVTGDIASPRAVVEITVGAALLLAVALIRPAWPLVVWPARIDRRHLRRVLAFSLPLIAFTASQYGMRSVDIVILRAYGTPHDVGVYAIAYQSYTMLQQVTTTVSIVLLPLFVSLGQAGRSDVVRRYLARVVPQATLLAASFGGIAAAILYVSAPIVFGDRYADASAPLAILSVALALHAAATLVSPVLMLHERSGAVAAVNVAALGVNVAGDVLLVGLVGMGVTGPAVATAAAMMIIAVGYRMVASRDVGIATRVSPLPLLPAIVSIAAILALRSPTGVVVAIAGAVVATALILRFGSLFDTEDAVLLAKLDLPAPVRSRLVAAVTRLAR